MLSKLPIGSRATSQVRFRRQILHCCYFLVRNDKAAVRLVIILNGSILLCRVQKKLNRFIKKWSYCRLISMEQLKWGRRVTIKSNKLNSSNQPHGLPSLDFLIYCYLIAFVVGHIIFVFPIVFSFSFEVWGIHNIITTALCYKMLWFWKGRLRGLCNVNHLCLWQCLSFICF